MRVRGINHLSLEDLRLELEAGGRFVFFEYCVSLVFVTLRRPTDVYFLRRGDRGFVKGLPYSLLSLVLGWWGIPWGFVYTPLTLVSNLSGGVDVTHDVWVQLCSETDGV